MESFGTLISRVLLGFSLVLAAGLVAISRRRPEAPKDVLRLLSLVVASLFVSALPDAVPLPHIYKMVGSSIGIILAMALVWTLWKMAERSR